MGSLFISIGFTTTDTICGHLTNTITFGGIVFTNEGKHITCFWLKVLSAYHGALNCQFMVMG